MLKLVLLLLVASAYALHIGKPDAQLVEKPKKHNKKHNKKPLTVDADVATGDVEVCNTINHKIADDEAGNLQMQKCSQDGTESAVRVLQSGKPSETREKAEAIQKETYGKCLSELKDKDGKKPMFEQVPKDCVDDMADSSVQMMCDFGMGLSQPCAEMADAVMKEKSAEIEACGQKEDYNHQLAKAMDDEIDFSKTDQDSLLTVSQKLMDTCVKLTPVCNEQYSYVVANNAKQASMEAFAGQISGDGPKPVHQIVVLFKKPKKTSSSHILKLVTHGSVV